VVGIEDLMAGGSKGLDLFRMGSPYRRVIVQEAARYTSIVRDLGSGGSFEIQNTTPSGRLPRPGDIWMVSNEMGVWTFHKMMDSAADSQPLATALAVAEEMSARNEYRWQPFDNPRSNSVEVPQGSYIGERRLFEAAPNERWLPINGAAVSRHRYRALFELIGETYGSGDGLTTFNIPDQDSSYVSTGTMLDEYAFHSITGGSDYTVTTTATTIPGLTHGYTIPALASATDYTMEIEATIAFDNVYASSGLPDSEVFLRRNGTNYTIDTFTHSIRCRPVSNGLVTVTKSWRMTFPATGAYTIDLTAIKADATGTITILRENSSMSCKMFKAGGSVTVTGAATWYICCE
jgi:microcystin-dependent protein